MGLGLLIGSPLMAQPLEKGPADESAYWILKFNGRLKPIAVVYPYKLTFKKVKVGEEAIGKVKIMNKGYGTLNIERIYLGKAKNFVIEGTTCTKPLDFGKVCEITIGFKPTEPGKLSDQLYIETNDQTNKVITVSLYGEAEGAIIEKETQIPPPLPVPMPQEEKKKPKKEPKKAKPTEKKVVPKVKIWEVKPCDTLWDISSNVYGTPLLWAAIYEANKDKIMDPWMLTVGWKLKIPVLTPKEAEKYRKETVRLMEEMADRPLGPKCP